ncbi:hypothetical protein MHM95_06035 [Pseudoalteromonas sp. CnMc7-15]|uniref:hypothetical protein n=1 Tax=Pseudoalteromonas TaxID=53246 RepID=UPI0003B36500|nr:MULTISPECIES: hypothetical protein [Pseudoalteromonas]MCG7565846.1 hypothetical protein [Pseudoalteromonas sp. CnMc7-15]
MSWFTLDLATAYWLNKAELLAFVVASFGAYFSKPRDTSVLICAGVMAVGLACGDVLHANVLSVLGSDNQVYFWYLVWALLSILQALFVIFFHWLRGELFSKAVSVVLATMAINAFMNCLMFIDRNMHALNGSALPNVSSENSWLLWDIYSLVINANLLFLAIVLVLYRSFQGGNVWIFSLYFACLGLLLL